MMTFDELKLAMIGVAMRVRKNADTKIKCEIALKHGCECFWKDRGKGPCCDNDVSRAVSEIQLEDELMRIHPAAKILPDMSDSEFESLVNDIREHGLLCPIETVDDKIIDGRHRFKACKRVGIEPDFIEVDLNGQTAEQYVWSTNGARRHLTGDQLAAVAAELAKQFEKQRGGDRRSNRAKSKSPVGDIDRSSEKAAKMIGASARQTQRAQRVHGTRDGRRQKTTHNTCRRVRHCRVW